MSITKNITVIAFGINTGGGLVLLRHLLENIGQGTKKVYLDERVAGLRFDGLEGVSISAVKVSVFSRLWSSFIAARESGDNEVLLCFNSMPPIVRTKAIAITYVHAPYLFSNYEKKAGGIREWLRIVFERTWFRLARNNSSLFLVQTESMRNEISEVVPRRLVRILSFMPPVNVGRKNVIDTEPVGQDVEKEVEPDRFIFFYPADGAAHKNHQNLFFGWKILAEEGLFPKLVVTLTDEESATYAGILDQITQMGGSVTAIGKIDRDRVLDVLQQSNALIFPSLKETLGLPLLEASALSVPIIASELDFVRDVCAPSQTFNPRSPVSIARCVSRFMGIKKIFRGIELLDGKCLVDFISSSVDLVNLEKENSRNKK